VRLTLIRWLAVLPGAALLAACAEPPASQVEAASPPAASAPRGLPDPIERGRIAYQRACAACHEEGLDGAPVTGRPEDWAGRSRLWQAVLVEHAQRGYFDMPAKGGDVTLSDADVQAAAEHMLTLTHPQEPAG
jgi:cytochrome c5